MHIWTHVRAHVSTHTHIHMCTRTHTHTHVYMCVCVRVYMCILIDMRVAYIQRTHIYIHTYIHTDLGRREVLLSDGHVEFVAQTLRHAC
jgi:hypothetical protein